MTAHRHPTRHAIYLSLLMVLLASTAAAAAKIASTTASTATIVTVQYLVCMLLCLPTVLKPGLASLRTQRLGLHLVRGLAGVLGFYFYYAALDNIPMVDAMLLRQSAPLVVPLVMWAWTRDTVLTSAWLPLVIGFVGVAVILRPSPAGLSWWHAAGFISAVTLAISMVATFQLALTEPVSRILFYYFALSLLCVAPFSHGAARRKFAGRTGSPCCISGCAIYFTLELIYAGLRHGAGVSNRAGQLPGYRLRRNLGLVVCGTRCQTTGPYWVAHWSSAAAC